MALNLGPSNPRGGGNAQKWVQLFKPASPSTFIPFMTDQSQMNCIN